MPGSHLHHAGRPRYFPSLLCSVRVLMPRISAARVLLSPGLAQGLEDEEFLRLLDRAADTDHHRGRVRPVRWSGRGQGDGRRGRRGGRRALGTRRRRRPQTGRSITSMRDPAAHDHRPLHHVAQLPDVARPPCGAQRVQRLRCEAVEVLAVGGGELVQEVLGQQRNVLAALAQRRQRDGEDVEAVVEVLAEPALARRSASRSRLVAAMTRTSTGISCVPPTRRIVRSSSTRSSLAWSVGGHLADLVQEAACRRWPARTARARPRSAPVKAPFSCPNSSLSRSGFGMAAQLTATKGVAPRAQLVERPRHHFLAGAALPREENGRGWVRPAR